MFKIDEISLYRQKTFEDFEAGLQVKFTGSYCRICDGVLQHCEKFVHEIANHVFDSDFEFADFKFSFTISISAHLKRFLLISKAE